MAIDDNTSYELTGAQVKDLANKIKAKAADNIFVGATSAAPGSKGLVPQPQAGDETKFLSGDGTWKTVGDDLSYSTSEVKTNATWTGGETIYKKTIHGTFSSVPSSGLSWNHNISGLSYVVNIETTYKLGLETAWGNDGFLARSGMAVRVDSAKVYIDTNSSNNYSGVVDVTLWYTKTTD